MSCKSVFGTAILASCPIEMFHDLIRRARRKVFSHFHFDLSTDFGASIVLAGSGRSGTTWISNIINHRNEFRYIFEPLLPTRVPIFQHFNVRQYLRPTDDDPRFLKPMATLLAGKLRNEWADHFNRRFISQRRLIKEIRANLLLKTLVTHFPQVPVVFMLRHPCAVVISQLETKWWSVESDYEQTLSQKDLVQDFLQDLIGNLRALTLPFEKLIALWCVENIVPLKQFAPDETHVVFYEHFCREPAAEARRLFAYLKVQPDDAKLRVSLMSPSEFASPTSAIVKKRSLLDGWFGKISRTQVRRAMEILKLFGLEKIYGDSADPLVSEPRQALTVFPR